MVQNHVPPKSPELNSLALFSNQNDIFLVASIDDRIFEP